MLTKTCLGFFLVIMFIFVTACSGGGLPVIPDSTSPSGDITPHADQSTQSGHYLIGYWTIMIPEDGKSVEVSPARAVDLHLNVVKLLEWTPCTNCLSVGNLQITGPNELTLDLTIRHPFPGLPNFTGFDVRGIFISDADYTFPISERSIAWGDTIPRLLNADGHTSLFNPTEYPANSPAPPILKYYPGKMSPVLYLSATLNPFIAYSEGATRRIFLSGDQKTEQVVLHFQPGGLKFGYAVDVSWLKPDAPIIDPLTEFPIEANCIEAYKLSASLAGEITSAMGSSAVINVEVFDHQGLSTISSVTFEAPDLFSDALTLAYSTQTGEDSWLFSGTITNEEGIGDGSYPLLAKVVDTESDQNLGVINAWQVDLVGVGIVQETGWVRTWGGLGVDRARDLSLDQDENIIVVGISESQGAQNGTIDKFSQNGELKWSKVWGDTGTVWVEAGCLDLAGNIYVAGWFVGTVDFDPGSGADVHSSQNEDCFLSKFDADGNFLSVRTWGGTNLDKVYDIKVAGNDRIFMVGTFSKTVDFDWGPGSDIHTVVGHYDCFLMCVDVNMSHLWTKTWGGAERDVCQFVEIDELGYAYTSGFYEYTVDFNPETGLTDFHTSNGGVDAFFAKYDTNGSFQWARSWGGDGDDGSNCVKYDGIDSLYVAGWFLGTNVDFDPGDGNDYHTSTNTRDAFLSKFDLNGDFKYARTWGGDGPLYDFAYGISLDSSGDVYVSGFFDGADTDFDPSGNVDIHSSLGSRDGFLSKYLPDGNYIWTKTWGSSQEDRCNQLVVDSSDNIFVSGQFFDAIDFAPCGEPEGIHTSNSDSDSFLIKMLTDGCW